MKKIKLTDVQLAYLVGRSKALYLGGNSTHGYIEFEGYAEIERVESAVNKLIKRHSMLRTVINEDGTQHEITELPKYIIEHDDLSMKSKEDQENFITEYRNRYSGRIFECGKFPMFCLHAFELGNNTVRYAFDVDLMIMDRSSFEIFFRELELIYLGKEEFLPMLNRTFEEYVLLRESFKSERLRDDETFYSDIIKDFPVPADIPVSRNPDFSGMKFSYIEKHIDRKKWLDIKNSLIDRRIIPTVFLMVCYGRALSEWTGEAYTAVNVTSALRNINGHVFSGVIGDFTELIIADIDFRTEKDIYKVCKEVQKKLLLYMKHTAGGGIKLLRRIGEANGGNTNVVYPYAFTSSIDENGSELRSNILGQSVYQISQTPQVKLDCQVYEDNNELYIRFDYPENVNDAESVAEMHQYMIDLIMNQNAVYKAEKQHKYNMTSWKEHNVVIQQLFRKQAERMKDKIAVICGEEIWTYEELDRKSDDVAFYLEQNGCAGKRVAVEAYRKPETCATILGILKTGGSYIPVDPKWPDERKKYVLETSECSAYIDKNTSVGSYEGTYNIKGSPEDEAYIIFTSGSTGKPKGVMISQKSVCNTILDINDMLGINDNDIIAGISSFCFDLSVYDLFGAVTSGCKLLIVRDMQEMLNVVTEKKATIWNTVPAIMELFCSTLEKTCYLRKILLSGDWIPLGLRENIRNKMPDADVYSLGGATEGSIWSIFFPLDEVRADWKSIPYGYPLRNQQMWILNHNNEICPVGVSGEICIGGIGVANGYVGNDEKNRTQFFIHSELGRLYRTGDYGVFTRDGFIEFLGRKDFQIKLHGYRIELGEIESILDNSEGIERAVANVVNAGNNTQHLIAYAVPVCSERNTDNTSLSGIDRLIKEASDRFEHKVTPEAYHSINLVFDEIAVRIIENTLYRMRLFNETGVEIRVDKLFEEKMVLPKYMKLINQWMLVLANCDILDYDGTCICLKRPLSVRDTAELFEEVKNMKGYDSLKEYADFIRIAGENMQSLLLGDEDPLNILFPKGSWERAESMYTYNAAANYLNNMTAEAVADIAENMLADGKSVIKILEVGAGIGGTTGAVLQKLSDRFPKGIEYTYTDISDFFTDKAKEKFSSWPFISYGKYNLNIHPEMQEFEPQSYDIIIGANSVHDSAYIVKSLGYLRMMLKNDGVLVLLEGTKNQIFYKVTIGLIDGFTGYMDERIHNNEILLSVDNWKKYTEKAGFDGFFSFPEKDSREENFDQHIMIMSTGKERALLDYDKIISEISASLTEYMIPERIYTMNEIPLSLNGKIDRKSLPVPEYSSRAKEKAYIAPMGEIQEKIADCFRKVLGTDRLSANMNIFKVGADSLKAITISSELEKSSYHVTLSELYKYSDVISLSEYIAGSGINYTEENIPAFEHEEDIYSPFRMTDQQQSYYLGRVQNVTGVRGIPTGGYAEMYCCGYNNSKLENAMNMIIERHEIFRARFNEDFTIQFVRDVTPFRINVTDMNGKDKTEMDKYLKETRLRMMSSYPDMSKPPLIKMEATMLNGNDAVIHLYIDGLILDGWSVELFIGELGSLYNTGHYLYEEKPDFNFKDYVAYLEKQKETEKYKRDRDYWYKRIDTLPEAAVLPKMDNIRNLGSAEGTQNICGISLECFETLKRKASERGVSIFSVLLTSFAYVIGKWNMKKRFMLNIPEFNRPPLGKDIDKVMGVYSSFLLYTSEIDSNLSFYENVRHTQEEILELKEHNSFTGMEIIREINRRSGDYSTDVLVPIVFGMMPERPNYNENYLKIERELFRIVYQENHTSFVWIDINVARHGERIDFNWCSVKGLFNQEMINDMTKMQENILYAAAENNDIWNRPLKLELPERDRKIIYSTAHRLIGKSEYIEKLRETGSNIEDFCILDEELSQVPVDVMGYLCIKEKDDRLTHTGYIAKFNDSGDIVILGSNDRIVNIKGRKIELDNINNMVSGIEEVRKADTFLIDGILVLIYEGKVKSTDIREKLAEQVPEYMIPEKIISVENIPVAADGKTDISEVRKIFKDSDEPAVDTNTLLTEKVRLIIEEIMECDMSADDDFFEYGGDSIKAIKLLYRINKEFTEKYEMRDLYQDHTARIIAHTLMEYGV